MDSAKTLGEGISLAARYRSLLSNSDFANNACLSAGNESGVVRFNVGTSDPTVQGMVTEFWLGSLLAKARYATGRPVTPTHVSFATAAPRAHRHLVEVFGTRRIDFGAEASTMTFGGVDWDLPLVRSDPVLAEILRERADVEVAAVARPPRWINGFRRVLADCIG